MAQCKFCGYDWKSWLEHPKECPRCKRRLDRPENPKKGERKNLEEDGESEH